MQLKVSNKIQKSTESPCIILGGDFNFLTQKLTFKTRKDERQLQNDLNKLVDWTQTWGMRFNPSKYKPMRITPKRNPGTANYTMMGVNLEETNNITYLGVQI